MIAKMPAQHQDPEATPILCLLQALIVVCYSSGTMAPRWSPDTYSHRGITADTRQSGTTGVHSCDHRGDLQAHKLLMHYTDIRLILELQVRASRVSNAPLWILMPSPPLGGG